MNNNSFVIPVKNDDNCKRIISVRLSGELLEEIDSLATQSRRSRSSLIHMLLEAAVKNAYVEG